MIELVVTRNEDRSGAVSYRVSPTAIKIGNEADNGLNILHVETPEEWSGMTVRVQFLSKRTREEYVRVLDTNNTCEIGQPITNENGTLMIEALGENEYLAHTNNVVYTTLDHIDVDGEDVVYTPSQVDEILRNAQQYVNEAGEIVATGTEVIEGLKYETSALNDSARESAESAAESAATAESAKEEAVDIKDQFIDGNKLIEYSPDPTEGKLWFDSDDTDGFYTYTKEEIDELIEPIPGYVQSARESAESANASKEDIIHYRDEAEQFATEAKQDYTSVKADIDRLDAEDEGIREALFSEVESLNGFIDDEIANRIRVTNKLGKEIEETDESLNMLWSLNDGDTFKRVEQTENGMSVAPSDARYMTLDEVHGKTEQDTTNGYQLIDYGSYWKVPHTSAGVTSTPIFDDKGRLVRIDFSGVSTARYTRNYVLNKEMPAGTYTLSCGGPIVNKLNTNIGYHYLDDMTMRYFDPTGAPTTGTHTITLTKPWVIVNVALEVRNADYDVNGLSLRPMLELGSVAHDYEYYTGGVPSPSPSYPQSISSVENFTVQEVARNYGANLSSVDVYNENGGTRKGVKISPPQGVYTINIANTSGEYLTYGTFVDGATKATKLGEFASSGLNVELALDGKTSFVVWTVTDVSVINVTFKDKNFVPTSRTITPPRPLNKIDDYKDLIDVELGQWVYNNDAFALNELIWRMETNANWTYPRFASSYLTKNFVAGDFATADSLIGGYNLVNRSTIRISNNQAYVFAPFNSIEEWNAYLNDGNEHLAINPLVTTETEPINATDLAYLRSLKNTATDHHLIVTDQNGNDISYLLDYIVDVRSVTDVKVNGTSATTDGIANVPISGLNKAGVIASGINGFAVNVNNGNVSCNVRTKEQFALDSNSYFISKGTLNNVLTDYLKSSWSVEKSITTTETAVASIELGGYYDEVIVNVFIPANTSTPAGLYKFQNDGATNYIGAWIGGAASTSTSKRMATARYFNGMVYASNFSTGNQNTLTVFTYDYFDATRKVNKIVTQELPVGTKLIISAR